LKQVVPNGTGDPAFDDLLLIGQGSFEMLGSMFEGEICTTTACNTASQYSGSPDFFTLGWNDFWTGVDNFMSDIIPRVC